MIREEMTRNGFTDRTVRKYLPAEAKMLSKVRQSGEFAAHNSANLDLLGLDLDSNYTQLTKEQLSKFRKTRLIEIIEKLQQLVSSNNNNNNNNNVNKSKRIRIDIDTKPKPKLQNKDKPYSGNHRWISNEKIDKILQLHNEGKSSRTISNITGISKNTVLRRLRLAAGGGVSNKAQDLSQAQAKPKIDG